MVTTKITTRQIKGEPNALEPRKTTAIGQTINIQEGTYAIGKRFAGATAINHPDWVGATGEFHVYLDRFDQLVLNDLGGFPDLSTRIAKVVIVGGIITAVVDERGHVNGVIDGYQVTYIDGASRYVHGDDVQEALDSIDAYFGNIFTPQLAVHIRQDGEDAYDYPVNTIFETDGYAYEVGENRLLVTVNGILQFTPLDYVELSNTSIQFQCQIDHDDVVDIFILPGALGGSGNTTSLQGAYYNTELNDKTIYANEGSINLRSSSNSVLTIESSHSSHALTVSNSNGRALDVQGDARFSNGSTFVGKVNISSSPESPLNLPVFTSDPDNLTNGDTWISDNGGTVKLNVRVGGVTKSITFS